MRREENDEFVTPLHLRGDMEITTEKSGESANDLFRSGGGENPNFKDELLLTSGKNVSDLTRQINEIA